jgi:hypothetical protein
MIYNKKAERLYILYLRKIIKYTHDYRIEDKTSVYLSKNFLNYIQMKPSYNYYRRKYLLRHIVLTNKQLLTTNDYMFFVSFDNSDFKQFNNVNKFFEYL